MKRELSAFCLVKKEFPTMSSRRGDIDFLRLRFGLLLFAAPLLLSGCAAAGAESQPVALQLNDTGLSPNSVSISAGQPVELHLENRTGADHELAVADIPLVTSGSGEHNMAGMSGGMETMNSMPPIHMVIRAREKQSIMFTPSKAGSYEFKCLTPGHEEQGMLIVTN
jgi:uncharacterized cupredoxin-like copper-binding protein